MDETPVRTWIVLGAGVIGGAAIGKMAFDHMFVHGLTDEERKRLVGLGVGAVFVYGAAYALGVDSKWLNTSELVEEAGKQIEIFVKK